MKTFKRKFHKNTDGIYVSLQCPNNGLYNEITLQEYDPIIYYALVICTADNVTHLFKGYETAKGWYDKYGNIIVRTKILS